MATTPITIPFARDGTKNPIDPTRTDGIINLTQGYTDDYSRQLGVDPAAKAVERDKMNWLLNLITGNIQDWQLASNPQWANALQYQVASIVRYAVGANDERIYRAIAVPPVGVVPTNVNFWEEVPPTSVLRSLIPMPYQGIVTVATDFNTLVTNGTWVFDANAIVASSANSPSGAVAGMLETRLTGNGANSLMQRYTAVNGGRYARGRNSSGAWAAWVTEVFPVPIAQGGTGATTAAAARTNLGLGSAAVRDIGTSGANVPVLDANNTWSGIQTVSIGVIRSQGYNAVANYGRYYGGNGNAFLEYDGAKWAVNNPANSNYTVIDGGGTTYTTGNLSPVSKTGDVMTGALTAPDIVSGTVRVRAPAGNTNQVFIRPFGNETTIDSVNSSNSAFADLTFNATGYNFKGGDLRIWGGQSVNFVNINNTAFEQAYFQATRYNFQGGAINAVSGYDTGSSLKLKDIIGELPYGLEEVRQVATYIGKYKPEYNPDGRKRAFLDADQLAKLMPELVDEKGVEFNGERVSTIKNEQVAVPLYRAVAQLADLVDELRAEIKVLKGEG